MSVRKLAVHSPPANAGKAVVRSPLGGDNVFLKKPRKIFVWKGAPENLLMSWLEVPENYDRWKSTLISTGPGKAEKISGDSKSQIALEIAALLREHNFADVTGKKVQDKIEDLEVTYKKAVGCLNQTGEGLTEEDLARGIDTVEAKAKTICRHFDKLNPIFSRRPCMVPPYLSDTISAGMEAHEMLFGQTDTMAQDKKESYDKEDVAFNASLVAKAMNGSFEKNSDVFSTAENLKALFSEDITADDIAPASAFLMDYSVLPDTESPASVLSVDAVGSAPSQQRKLTRSGEKTRKEENGNRHSRAGGTSAGLEGLLADKESLFEHRVKMDDRRQKLAETRPHLEHEARMKELELKKIEAKTRSKEAAISILMLQLSLDQSKRVLSE